MTNVNKMNDNLEPEMHANAIPEFAEFCDQPDARNFQTANAQFAQTVNQIPCNLRDHDDAVLHAMMSWSLTKIEAHRGDARRVLGLDPEADDDTLKAAILAICDAAPQPEGVMATALAYLRHDLGVGAYPLQVG